MKVVNKVRPRSQNRHCDDTLTHGHALLLCEKEMSTLIMALGQILRDLLYFMIVLVVVIVMFADVRPQVRLETATRSKRR
jgi:hypothetical protein